MTKRTVIILLGSLLCILLICALVTCTDSGLSRAEAAVSSYNKQVAIYNDAATAFNASIQPIVDANGVLDEVIAVSQALLDAGEIPFDPQSKTDLEQAIDAAVQSKVPVPAEIPLKEEMTIPDNATAEDLERLTSMASSEAEALRLIEVPAPIPQPDYSAITEALLDAQSAFERNVLIQKQVTAPSDDFVLERLKQIDTILSLATVTSSNDPNGLLGKEGGYIGCIYFSDSRVDKTQLNLKPGEYNVIAMGTVGGGAIEIYATIEDAETRNAYLTTYDETDLDPGSHVVVGTMVVRTSSKLTDEQQTELTNQIVALLTELVAE